MALIPGDVNSFTYSLKPLTYALKTQNSKILDNSELFKLLFYQSLCCQNFDKPKLSLEKSKVDKTLTITMRSMKLEAKIDCTLDRLREAFDRVFSEENDSLTITLNNKSFFAKYLQPALLLLTHPFGLCYESLEDKDDVAIVLSRAELTDEIEDDDDEVSPDYSIKRRMLDPPLHTSEDDCIPYPLFSELHHNDSEQITTESYDKLVPTPSIKKEKPLFFSRIVPKGVLQARLKPAANYVPTSIKTGAESAGSFKIIYKKEIDCDLIASKFLDYRSNFTIDPSLREYLGEEINLLTRTVAEEIESLLFYDHSDINSQSIGLSPNSTYFNGEVFSFPLHRTDEGSKTYVILFFNVNIVTKFTTRSYEIFIKQDS